jgi:ABC-type sugar transport system substrate-binding protein
MRMRSDQFGPASPAHRPRLVRGRAVIGLLAVLCFCAPAVAAELKVAFLAPDPAGTNPFWARTIDVMQAAADDLGVTLEIDHSKSNTYSNRKDALALLKQTNPDYFLTGYYTGGTNAVLDYAERRKIRTFVFNSGVDAKDKDGVGRPREQYRYWIGQMTPDGHKVGYELADLLITRAKEAGADRPVQVIGLGGMVDISSNDYRQNGLQERIETESDAELDRYVHAEWSERVARQSILQMVDPNSPSPVIWASGDPMALGAVKALHELDLEPGRDVLVGGIDWIPEAVEAVIDGEMEVTFGGHFMEGAWALILAHDHHHGHDFADDLQSAFHTPYTPITADNARAYRDKLGNADWSVIDFKQFSKVHNPDLEQYRWPLDTVLEQLPSADTED